MRKADENTYNRRLKAYNKRFGESPSDRDAFLLRYLTVGEITKESSFNTQERRTAAFIKKLGINSYDLEAERLLTFFSAKDVAGIKGLEWKEDAPKIDEQFEPTKVTLGIIRWNQLPPSVQRWDRDDGNDWMYNAKLYVHDGDLDKINSLGELYPVGARKQDHTTYEFLTLVIKFRYPEYLFDPLDDGEFLVIKKDEYSKYKKSKKK